MAPSKMIISSLLRCHLLGSKNGTHVLWGSLWWSVVIAFVTSSARISDLLYVCVKMREGAGLRTEVYNPLKWNMKGEFGGKRNASEIKSSVNIHKWTWRSERDLQVSWWAPPLFVEVELDPRRMVVRLTSGGGGTRTRCLDMKPTVLRRQQGSKSCPSGNTSVYRSEHWNRISVCLLLRMLTFHAFSLIIVSWETLVKETEPNLWDPNCVLSSVISS